MAVGAHRYWRLMIDAVQGNPSYKALQEIVLLSGGSQVFPVDTSESSFYAPNNMRASRLFDGNMTDVWGGAWAAVDDQPAWVGWDMGSAVAFDAILIYPWVETTSAIRIPKTFRLAYSDDGSTWTAGVTVTNAPAWNYRSPYYLAVDMGAIAGHAIASGNFNADAAAGVDRSVVSGVRVTMLRGDVVDGGAFRIYGPTLLLADGETEAVPVGSRHVRLFNQQTAVLVREGYSGADGQYSFDNIRDGEYFVIAHDPTGAYNAAIADRVKPEPMPR